MTALKFAAAGALLAALLLIAAASAEAVTARQQSLQGYGVYTTSKGFPEGYGGGYYMPRPVPPGFYGYGYGYRPWGFWHQRYFYGY